MKPLDNCRRCGVDITSRRLRSDRQWCSKECRTYFKRKERRIEARRSRPRCLICSAPIQWGKTGLTMKTRTCGDKVCVMRLNNWFSREARKTASA